MYKRVVPCGVPGCKRRAAYKVASPWSDGSFIELKTYGLTCSDHLRKVFREADRRHKVYCPRQGETVEAIGIYRYECGKADRDLERLWGLEKMWGRDKAWGLLTVRES
jgi:hypothetical protein